MEQILKEDGDTIVYARWGSTTKRVGLIRIIIKKEDSDKAESKRKKKGWASDKEVLG